LCGCTVSNSPTIWGIHIKSLVLEVI
jgi:hypothetical protein